MRPRISSRILSISGKVAVFQNVQILECFRFKDSNGVLIERSDITESVYFALLFEFDGDQKAIRHVMYNCTASRPTIESQTKESSIEPGTETLSIAADPREDGLVKSRTGDDTSTATYNNWYKNVYVPSATAASSGSGTSGS